MALTDAGNIPLAPSGSTIQNLLPEWYTNYAMDILSKQKAVADQPYATYQGPRVADFTPNQQAGFNMTGQAATSYAQPLDTAIQATEASLGRSALGAAQPGLTQAAGLFGTSLNQSGLTAAQPFLTASGGTAVDNIGQYMNPFTENVVNRIGQMGARTLNEQILPGISDRFIGGGSFGGSRQAEAVGKSIRDAMEGISAEQAKALESGYGQAAGLSQADLARQAQLASTAGQLGTQAQSGTQAAASGLAGLGESAGRLYGADTSQQNQTAGQMASLAQQTQAQGLAGAGALQQVGAQQQALGQKSLDTAYSDFLRQQGYPQDQITGMVGALQGVKSAVPTSTLTEGYAAYNDANAVPKTSGLQNAATTAAILKDVVGLFK